MTADTIRSSGLTMPVVERLQQVEASNQDEQTKATTEKSLQTQIVTLNASIQ